MTPQMEAVKAWSETVRIPTYAIGRPDKNPMFLEKRVYQGSSGVVYSYPVIDRVGDEKEDRPYCAVFLENRYLKIMLLPELGGRVQMALDKTNGYHFIYYNRVIKPALVGLAGPWISGGIEFNWPQHHRPSTFEPVDWRIVENADGSRTVWCSEIERMFFTQGTHGFTLYPERAYLEISVQLYNRTAAPQSFLWWANPAVHVNDDYQSVFPPDVHAVMDHGKRDVSDFPIATGTYYRVNYAPGTDISRYKNIPVPTSYMAYHSDFDFVGDYDHGQRAGMLHVADHHLVPGKKQWTWGNGDFGRAWDRQLTDEDGPYIELMCGAFTDNQPDFSWLMPGEEKRFTQVFMPYKLIGPATNASRDAVVHLQIEGDTARFGVYVTAPRTVTVELRCAGAAVFTKEAALSPEAVLIESVALPAGCVPQEVTLRVLAAPTELASENGEAFLSRLALPAPEGRELVAFTPLPDEKGPIPSAATPAKPPREIESNEELFLNGLHLEQYRHATFAPEQYYEEALRRDPFDSRCNNALGLLLYRRGRFAEAEPYFRKAIESLTRRNPNPYDGEPHYNLGLALKMQGRYGEAFDAFYKAAWNAAWQDAAYFELARLAVRCFGDEARALELANSALRRNHAHRQARHLKLALLRRAGRQAEALRETALALELEPMDYGALWEQKLLSGEDGFTALVGSRAHNFVEVALDYAHAGLFTEATALFEAAPNPDALTLYFLAGSQWQSGESARAAETLRRAAAMPPDYVFPHRLECVLALEAAMQLNPADARAPYYLGNFWYAHRRYAEAIECWEKARALDPTFPTVHRNLGLAYFNKLGEAARAREAYARAFALDPADARVLFELDQLEKKLNAPPAERLARLEGQRALVALRDDLTIEFITLLNLMGRYAEAHAVLMTRKFHPWEGGEGKTTGQYVASLIGQARALLGAARFAEATALLEAALVYPPNLGEGKLPNALDNDVHFYLGLVAQARGEASAAQRHFERAAAGAGVSSPAPLRGVGEPTAAVYYNDQPPEMIFYQGLARQKLGREAEARGIFENLIEYGRAHLDDAVKLDYFAVSLPTFLVFEEDLSLRNRIHCHYLLALGGLGLGDPARAEEHFAAVLQLDAAHQGAWTHRQFLTELTH